MLPPNSATSTNTTAHTEWYDTGSGECNPSRYFARMGATPVVLNRSPRGSTDKSAQGDSLEFAGLAEALGKIFSKEKIQSILSNLPPKSKIYGYDYGDFSGDDGMDVVLSTRQDDAAPRVVDIFFFLNYGAEFELVHSLQRPYMLEAIEVGFSIDEGVCHITEKTGEFDWRITGYSMQHGLFRRVEEWTTRRLRAGGGATAIGFEQSQDYLTNLGWEHYFGVNTGKSYLEQKFYSLPVYPTSLELPPEIPVHVGDSSALMVVSGGSSWHGPDDSNMRISARYDTSSVLFTVLIHDDRLLYHTHADSADHLALYFDLSGKPRIQRDGTKQRYAKETQISLVLFMGDGEARGPAVELHGEKRYDSLRSLIGVTVTADPTKFNTREFTLSMPRGLFSRSSVLHGAGFCAVYHDVDHEARRDWATLLSTSRGYIQGKPETYGRISFLTDPIRLFERLDLRTRNLARRLRSAGLHP